MIILLDEPREMLQILSSTYPHFIIVANLEELSDEIFDLLYPLETFPDNNNFSQWMSFAIEITASDASSSILSNLLRRGLLDTLDYVYSSANFSFISFMELYMLKFQVQTHPTIQNETVTGINRSESLTGVLNKTVIVLD